MRLAKEREIKKAQRLEAKREREAKKLQIKADKRAEAIKAGRAAEDLDAEEAEKELTSKASQQLKRYQALTVQAQVIISGMDREDSNWMEFKETRVSQILLALDEQHSFD